MTDSIDSFVKQVKADGVEAGKREAERIAQEARAEAAQIVAKAKDEAARIVQDARAEAEHILEQNRHELELAARDAILKLREGIVAAIQGVLAHETGKALADENFLATLIHDTMREYARQDARHIGAITINVSERAASELADWAVAKLVHSTSGELPPDLNLQFNLDQLGFEYTVNEAMVEVTVESVAEVLGQLVSEKVRAAF